MFFLLIPIHPPRHTKGLPPFIPFSFSTKPPTTGRLNLSAEFPGMTFSSASNGPSKANPSCPQKINKPNHWQELSTSHD
jgi:hypothetical protein